MIAKRAREVIGAVVEDDRITCMKGWRMEGVSKARMSVDVSCEGPNALWIITFAVLEIASQSCKR